MTISGDAAVVVPRWAYLILLLQAGCSPAPDDGHGGEEDGADAGDHGGGQGSAEGGAAGAGDGGEGPVCDVGDTIACACEGGRQGERSCDDDRLGWSLCDCPGPDPCLVEDECDSSEQCRPGTVCGRGGDAGCRRCVPPAPYVLEGEDPCEGRRGEDVVGACGECGGDCSAQMVRIEAGTFVMGSPQDEPCRGLSEDLHEVTITRPFLMWATEVTMERYEAVTGVDLPTYRSCGEADCPVQDLTWHAAVRFCNRLSRIEGLEECYDIGEGRRIIEDIDPENDLDVGPPVVWPRGPGCLGYRLPTEAEWEYAARAGTTTAFYSGGIDPQGCRAIGDDCPGVDPALDRVGWYGCNDDNRLHPVAHKPPNAWGLHDVLGNAWEWVWDWDLDFPDESPDPTGRAGDSSAFKFRVIRGGGVGYPSKWCRSAARGYSVATSGSAGFRPVRMLAR